MASGKWKMKHGILIGVFAIFSVLYFMFVPRPIEVEVATATVGSFRETIQADGILRSKERYKVLAFAEGDIKRILIKEGDSVRKGQVITELRRDFSYHLIKAPIDGIIAKVYHESAGPVQRGEPIVEIMDMSQLEIMVELLTTDAVRLKSGTEVVVESLGGAVPIQTKVSRISKVGFKKQSALGVEEERTEVCADLNHLPTELLGKLGSNFHVGVTFLLDENAKSLRIPIGAIFRDGRSWAVFSVVDSKARKTRVEVSGMNSTEASIKSGLAEGERVIVYPGDLVKDGTRVSSLDSIPLD